jgi:hypothetical protein
MLVGIGLLLLVNTLAGDGRSDGEASRYEDRARQIEQRLIVSPQDPKFLLQLAGARFHVAGQMIKGGHRQSSEEVVQQNRLASQAWSKYLEVAREPDRSAAEAMQPVYVSLAEAAPDAAKYREEMRKAALASEIDAKQAPSVDALMTLAYYRDFAFDWKAADRAATDALALARMGPDLEKVQRALSEYRQLARETKSQMTEG